MGAYAFLPFGLLVAFACQDNMVAEKTVANQGDEINFALSSEDNWTSRSANEHPAAIQETRHFLTLIGKDSLFLYTKIEDNTMPVFTQQPASRAVANTMQDATPSFYLNAVVEDGSQFMNHTKVTKADGGALWDYSPKKYWPQTQEVHFYAFGYEGVIPAFYRDGDVHKGSFSYELPEPDENKVDATKQPDLIFAITPNQSKQSVNDAVHMKFYHALSAVVFKVGNMPEADEKLMQSVAIKNVSGKGSCIMTSISGNGIDYDWTVDESAGKKTYTQTFNTTLTKDDFNNAEQKVTLSNDETTFMMLPQELTEENPAELEIRFKIGNPEKGEYEYCFTHPIAINWEANKRYTYTLTTKRFVEVDVDDRLSGEKNTVKDQVKIQNTGLAKAYIRAAIVGYWVNEQGDVVASWNINDDVGQFTNLAPNSGWILGEDNFYYHEDIVSIGNYTKPLFDKYELVENPPIVDTSLELNIIVQAVDANEMNWEDVVIDNTSKKLRLK